MRSFQPKYALYLGEFGQSFGGGIYLATYPLFIYEFIPAHTSSANAAALLAILTSFVSIKFFLEFAINLSSSYMADFLPSLSRRFFFLLGFAFHATAFLGYAFSLNFSNHLVLLLISIVGADSFRCLANSFISGTLDGWSISQQKELEKNVDTIGIFRTSGLAEKLGLLLGAISAISILQFIPSVIPIHDEDRWRVIWLVAVFVTLITHLLLQTFTRGYKRVEFGATGTRPSLTAVLKESFTPGARLSIAAFSFAYTLLMVTSYTWPSIVNTLSDSRAYTHWFPVGLMTVGVIGAFIAKSKWCRGLGMGPQTNTLRNITMILGTTIGLSIALANFPIYAVIVAAIISLVLGRLILAISWPVFMSGLHSHLDGNESMRATVVSIRFAFANLVCSVVLFATSNIGRMVADWTGASFSAVYAAQLLLFCLLGIVLVHAMSKFGNERLVSGKKLQ